MTDASTIEVDAESSSEDLFDKALKSQEGISSSDSIQKITDKLISFELGCSNELVAITYWFKRRFSDPDIYDLAMTVFQVPGSQFSVERNFSTFKWIFNDRRLNTDAALMDDIMIINLNKKFSEK